MQYLENGIGHADTDTSYEAATTGDKLTVREQVYRLFYTYADLTTETCAKLLNRDLISIKPRLTELKNEGKIVDSGKRIKGPYGTNIIVWRLANDTDKIEPPKATAEEKLQKLVAAVNKLKPALTTHNVMINKGHCIRCGAVDGILKHAPGCEVASLLEVLESLDSE